MDILEQLENRNPGEILRDILGEICPFVPENGTSCASMFDEILDAQREFSKLVYKSSLNYLLRRLITAAIYIRKAYFNTTEDDKVYRAQLRKYIKEKTKIPEARSEQIVTLLHFCVLEHEREPSRGTKRSVRREAKLNNAKCYICGRDVLHNRVKPSEDIRKENAEIEHRWPKSLGGSNKKWNLVIVCARCNELKKNVIDSSDFHYEHICAVTDESMDNFNTDFNWEYRIPILAKTEFTCAEKDCQNAAHHYGNLNFIRSDPDDSWHFLNIFAFCNDHTNKGV